MIKTKFVVQSVDGEKDNKTLKLTAVVQDGKKGENDSFWKHTPAGSIELQCCNDKALEGLEVGKEVYVDFHPVHGKDAHPAT